MAALIGVGEEEAGGARDDVIGQIHREQVADDLDGVPIFDNRPIDFSGGAGLDGVPLVCVYMCACVCMHVCDWMVSFWYV